MIKDDMLIQMEALRTRKGKELYRNPLGIIALFIVLVYGVACLLFGFSADKLTTDERSPMIWFTVLFPVLVLLVFAWLVTKHHNKLYAPIVQTVIASAIVLCVAVAHAGEKEVIASVIAAEACGEGPIGMALVSETIHNRAVAWHKTPYQVVTARNQYYGYTAKNRDRLYAQCQQTADRLATAILERKTGNKTRGALYFLLKGEPRRTWHKIETYKYKKHTFYK